MFSTLSKLALGATILVGSIAAQQRTEIGVPVTTSNPALVGFVADCYAGDFNGFSLIGYQARVGGFNFGTGTLESRTHGDSAPVNYSALGFNFSIAVPFTWQAYCYNLGSVTFSVSY